VDAIHSSSVGISEFHFIAMNIRALLGLNYNFKAAISNFSRLVFDFVPPCIHHYLINYTSSLKKNKLI